MRGKFKSENTLERAKEYYGKNILIKIFSIIEKFVNLSEMGLFCFSFAMIVSCKANSNTIVND